MPDLYLWRLNEAKWGVVATEEQCPAGAEVILLQANPRAENNHSLLSMAMHEKGGEDWRDVLCARRAGHAVFTIIVWGHKYLLVRGLRVANNLGYLVSAEPVLAAICDATDPRIWKPVSSAKSASISSTSNE
ncbi:MAG: hypothetical protein JW942_06860 [Opitutales bacterium]|nr:hypothetical protein [Opitutales bacterium]